MNMRRKMLSDHHNREIMKKEFRLQERIFREAGMEQSITLLEGDALEILKNMEGVL